MNNLLETYRKRLGKIRKKILTKLKVELNCNPDPTFISKTSSYPIKMATWIKLVAIRLLKLRTSMALTLTGCTSPKLNYSWVNFNQFLKIEIAQNSWKETAEIATLTRTHQAQARLGLLQRIDLRLSLCIIRQHSKPIPRRWFLATISIRVSSLLKGVISSLIVDIKIKTISLHTHTIVDSRSSLVNRHLALFNLTHHLILIHITVSVQISIPLTMHQELLRTQSKKKIVMMHLRNRTDVTSRTYVVAK